MNDEKHTMPMAEFKEKFGDTMASMEKHLKPSSAIEAEWFDRNEKLPEEGAIVSLLSYGGRVYQAKKRRLQRPLGVDQQRRQLGAESVGMVHLFQTAFQMSNRLHIQGEYPPDWPEINARACEAVGHRCIRCGHPYRKGEHRKGEWSPCDKLCTHKGAIRLMPDETVGPPTHCDPVVIAGDAVEAGFKVEAQWRILTCHHFDGDKSNCEWWNLLVLCQRCHLTIQGRVKPEIPYFLEHSAWAKPYVAGFYAHKYEGRLITREEAVARMDALLAHERRA